MDLIVSFFQGLAASYGAFFSLDALISVITNPVSLGIIGTLILLEGILSADNALVLAVMVRSLPKNQQRKALFYGIWGAYIFRFIAIGVGVYLVKIQWVKILGALYLLWLPIKYFYAKYTSSGEAHDDIHVNKVAKSFWGVVLQVELMDIAFSIDSVLAAFGLSEQLWVLFTGAIFGILMMRGVAQIFMKLIEKYPELESAAYILIALIGTKMMASAFGYHVAHWVFFALLGTVFLGTFVLHHLKLKYKSAG
ncbi:MAG: TerC family protein [Desulfitobacteriaceae bacterium]